MSPYYVFQQLDGRVLHTCGCGQCVCLRSFLLNLVCKDSSQSDEFGPMVHRLQKNRFNTTLELFKKIFPTLFSTENTEDTKQKRTLTAEFESLVNEPSEVRAMHQGTFLIRGFFSTGLFRPLENNTVKAYGNIRIGMYGARVPLTHMGLPERPTWMTASIDTNMRALFRLNRVRVDQQGFLSIVTSMMHMWAPFLVQHHRWNSQREAMYAEHHDYRIALIPSSTQFERAVAGFKRSEDDILEYTQEKPSVDTSEILTLPHYNTPEEESEDDGESKKQTCESPQDTHVPKIKLLHPDALENQCPKCQQGSSRTLQRILIPESTLSVGVMTFFQCEQARVGSALSILATLVLAGVFLVLIHRIGAFFICFRRREVRYPRLMVSPLLKKISCGHISENHAFAHASFEEIDQ